MKIFHYLFYTSHSQKYVLEANPDFKAKLEIFNNLLNLRKTPINEIDQKYITAESIIKKVNLLSKQGLIDGKRIMMIGDSDLTGLAIAIFCNPEEVVVADIDERLSEIYFEATLEYDLPVRYLYHDMRIKVIEILKKQYSVIIFDPPPTHNGIKLFFSRAIEMIYGGPNSHIIMTLNQKMLSSGILEELKSMYDLDSFSTHTELITYEDQMLGDVFIFNIIKNIESKLIGHYLHPVYTNEVNKKLLTYKCECGNDIGIGLNENYKNYDELQANGCPKCGYKGIFVFQSDIQLK